MRSPNAPGVSVEAVSALERGFRKTPHADTVALLAGALGVSAAERAELESIATRAPVALNGRKLRLPRPATRLIGREREVADILALLPTSALVTLTGAGGVGKSRARPRGRRACERGLRASWPSSTWSR